MQEDDTIEVVMPFAVKKQLVTDWEHMTQEPGNLVKLPRELTAADVMAKHTESKPTRFTPEQNAPPQELIDDFRLFFYKGTIQWSRGRGQTQRI